MARYRFSIQVDAPPERVFALWTDLQRMGEWVGGVTGEGSFRDELEKFGRIAERDEH